MTLNDSANEGILLVNKERGKTSFHLVYLLRKLTGIKKIGHTGTLDPFATGVMILLIGRNYTKIADQFINDHKIYNASLHLGAATNTFDCDGEITQTSTSIPTLSEIETALCSFQGEVMQTPPMFSAKKINGQKLYNLARKGIEVERQAVQVSLETTLISYNYPTLELSIKCSKGTYIRSIANDLGIALGSFAHLKELVRTECGKYSLKECVDTSSLKDLNFPYRSHLLKIHENL
ncbi:MAG: tRNA pseudouridine(55) synthase TruB [Simkaniaceae bacterium]|nr:tRNA pseudouridine(55) synthase TruB [Simkaniaceae bacterium]